MEKEKKVAKPTQSTGILTLGKTKIMLKLKAKR